MSLKPFVRIGLDAQDRTSTTLTLDSSLHRTSSTVRWDLSQVLTVSGRPLGPRR